MNIATVIIASTIICAEVVRWQLRRRHERNMAVLLEFVKMVKAMLEGHRPVVTKPPKGMTMSEAQAHIDRIWAGLQFDAKPGVGGSVN